MLFISFVKDFIFVHYNISHFLLYIYFSNVRFSQFRLLPSFSPLSVSFLVSLALLFLFRPLFLAPSLVSSSSFPFSIFLFHLNLYPLFVFFFPSFLLSFLRSSLLLLFFWLPPT